eukprot:1157626-Pelagomonas_calceolata.AAC.4
MATFSTTMTLATYPAGCKLVTRAPTHDSSKSSLPGYPIIAHGAHMSVCSVQVPAVHGHINALPYLCGSAWPPEVQGSSHGQPRRPPLQGCLRSRTGGGG